MRPKRTRTEPLALPRSVRYVPPMRGTIQLAETPRAHPCSAAPRLHPRPVPAPKTASRGLRQRPHHRLSRWHSQPVIASGKSAPRYDFARRGAVLPQNNCPTPARLSSLDGFIDGAVGAFNGSADAGPVPLPADLIKAMVAVESGYNRSAYINDPMQVNVPGDWVARKAEWGLVRGSAPGQAVGIVAGIGWLSYKAFRYDSSGNRASFLGWEAAAVRYNGGGDPNYLSKIRAARARINQGC
jgi:hypothetical protein